MAAYGGYCEDCDPLQTCEAEALKVLKGLKEHTVEYLRKTEDGLQMENDLFACWMNAHVVEGAERVGAFIYPLTPSLLIIISIIG